MNNQKYRHTHTLHTHTHTRPPTHLPNVSAGSWLKCQAMCMAAFRPHLSPYFTAAPGGDKEHRGASLPSRSVHHILPAPSCPSRLSNWWCLSCQSLRGFRYRTKAKEHNEWKAPSQIDFKLNQTPVFNYLSVLPQRNFKVAEKEQEQGGKASRGRKGWWERNANDSVPAWCRNRWPSGSTGADEWAVEGEPVASSNSA